MQFPFGSPKRDYFQRVFGLGFDAFISNLHSYSAHLVQQLFCFFEWTATTMRVAQNKCFLVYLVESIKKAVSLW